MKKLLLILFCILVVSQLGAIQVSNMKKIVSQPDGTILTLFLSGDEYSNRLHDENDYSVMKGKDGFYYYVIKDNAGKVIPSVWRVGQADPETLGIPKGITMLPRNLNMLPSKITFPSSKGSSIQGNITKGHAKDIVIFVNFKGSPAFEKPRSFYESIFNAKDSTSFSSYYKEVSYGKLNFQASFFPKCTSGENKAYIDESPRSEFEGVTSSNSTDQLLKRAIENVRKEIEATFTADELDLDNDGIVDYVTFILQGAPGEWNAFLWAHAQAIFTAGLNIHNKKVEKAIVMLEEWGDRGNAIRTLVHETFHIIGCGDYYQYGNKYVTPIHEYELMAYSRGHMSAYSKWKYSQGLWIKDIPEITTSGRYYLKSLASGPDSVCYKIASPIAGQYVALEFRKKEGKYEGTLPASGLITYRIKQEYRGNQGTNYELYIFRPGGSATQNGDLGKSYLSKESGRTALSNDSDIRLFFTNPENVELQVKNNFEITDVSSAEGDRIYFTVTFNVKKDTLYVKEGGCGTKDGSSWANALESLDKALDKCTPSAKNEIWIAGGHYKQSDDLPFKERVSVYGGFAGSESSIAEREMVDMNQNGRIEPWEFAHPTVLDLDYSSSWNEPSPSGFTTEWNGLTIDKQSFQFTIENGYVFNACIFQNFEEGGITFKGNGTLKNSLLTNNESGLGLLYLVDGGQVEGCVITKNHSSVSAIITIGTGYISNSLIANNETVGWSASHPGTPGILFASGRKPWMGVYLPCNSTGHLQNCTVVNNKTDNSEGWIVGDDLNRIRLYNTIVWGNLPSGGLDKNNVDDIKYCAIQEFNTSDYNPEKVEKNICLSGSNKGMETGVSYPLFVAPSTEAGQSADGWMGFDWALAEGSACIDKGSNDWVADENINDLKAGLRIMHGQVDIGAYEFEQKLAGTLEFTQLEKVYSGKALLPEYVTVPTDMKVQLSFKDLKADPVNAGEYTVTATIDDPLYEGSLTDIFTIQKADQEIFWEQELEQLSESGIQLLATASSGLPVRYESSDISVATIEGDILKIKKSGNCMITARQDGDGNRNAAPSVSKTITPYIIQSSELKAVSLIVADGSHSGLFKLLDAESLDNSHLIFYNSLGKMIYNRRNYANDYDMSGLSTGTYYYVLTWRDMDGKECSKKGFVEVVK